MRFKLDENLPIEGAAILCAAGHDAYTVRDQRLCGATDERLLAIVRKEERVLITLDLDFSDIRAYSLKNHAGVIILRPKVQDKDTVLFYIRRLLSLLDTESVAGKLWIVEARRVRIREEAEGA